MIRLRMTLMKISDVETVRGLLSMALSFLQESLTVDVGAVLGICNHTHVPI